MNSDTRPLGLPFSRYSSGVSLVLLILLGACSSGDAPQPYLELGKQALAARDYRSAVIQFKNAVAQEPGLAEAHFHLGLALARTPQLGEAEIEFRKAERLGFDRARLAPEIARVMIDQEKPQEALDTIREMQGAGGSGGDPRVLALSGEALLGLGRRVDAAAAFQQALQQDPRSPEARIGLARLATAEGATERALAILDEVLAQSPDVPNGWFLKANLLVDRGRPDEAADAYGNAIQVRPGDLRAYSALVPLLLARKDLAGAEQRVAELARVAPTTPSAHYLTALVAYHRGDQARARELMQLVLKAVPDDLRALLLAGTIELEGGRPQTAEKHLERLIALAPSEKAPRRMLATAYLREGKADKAADAIGPILSSSADDPATLRVMAEVAVARQDLRGAIRHLRRAVEIDSGNADLHTRLGELLSLAGNRAEGLSHLLKGLDLGPDRIAAAEAVVLSYLQDGDAAEARSRAEAVLQRAPNSAPAHRLLALVQSAMSEKDAARASLEKALALSPSFLPAARDLAQIDIASGDLARAAARYRSVFEKDPRQEEAALLLVGLLERTRAAQADVLSVLDRAILASADSPRLRVAKVQYLQRRGDRRAALEAAQTAVAALPDEPSVLLALARVQAAGGDYGQALGTYGKLSPLMPDSEAPALGAAEVHLLRQDFASARRTIESAIRERPERMALRIALVDVNLKARSYDAAVAAAREIRGRWPASGAGYAAEAQAQAASGNLAEAEKVLRAGMARTGEAGLANRLLGLLATDNRLDIADMEASRWVAAHPAHASVMAFMGDLRLAHGDHQQAVQWYRKGVAARPADSGVLLNLARGLGKAGDPGAMDAANRALAIAPDDPAILDTLGTLHARAGDLNAAISYFDRALLLRPDIPGVRLNLARALIKANRKAEAKLQLEEAARSDPGPQMGREISALVESLGSL